MSGKIVIRFTRDLNNSSKDDVITIMPKWATTCCHDVEVMEYSVVMTTASCSNNSNLARSYEQLLSAQNLRKYVHSLLALLPKDTEPFLGVQIDLPNAPTVLFNQKDLYENAWSIVNLVEVAISSWPSRV